MLSQYVWPGRFLSYIQFIDESKNISKGIAVMLRFLCHLGWTSQLRWKDVYTVETVSLLLRNLFFFLSLNTLTSNSWRIFIAMKSPYLLLVEFHSYPNANAAIWLAELLAYYLNNRVFLSRNYRLIVAQRKFDVLKTIIYPRSEASSANMLVLRTSNFKGATIRPIVPRHKHSIVFIIHH